MSRQVRFLLQRREQLGIRLFGLWLENQLLYRALVGTGCCLPTHLASRVRAMMPAAKGAEAEVPVCDSVHFCLRSVVTCQGTTVLRL